MEGRWRGDGGEMEGHTSFVHNIQGRMDNIMVLQHIYPTSAADGGATVGVGVIKTSYIEWVVLLDMLEASRLETSHYSLICVAVECSACCIRVYGIFKWAFVCMSSA